MHKLKMLAKWKRRKANEEKQTRKAWKKEPVDEIDNESHNALCLLVFKKDVV